MYAYAPARFIIICLDKIPEFLKSMNVNYSVHLNKYAAKILL